MKSLTPINRSIRLIALLLSLSTLAACSSTNSDGSTEGPEGGNTAPANKSDKLCGNQAADDKDQRCSEKPDKFGLAFVVTGATIPGSDPFSCSKDVCLSKANPPAATELKNNGGALLTTIGEAIKGPGRGSELATKFTDQLKSGDTKLVFEFDGIDSTTPKITADKPFKIYVWSYEKGGNIERDSVDKGYSSKSFFPNAKIDKDGYLTTDPGTLVFPIRSREYNVKTFLYVENARLFAKVDPNNMKLENAVIGGELLKTSVVSMIAQVEASCPMECVKVCINGKYQDGTDCTLEASGQFCQQTLSPKCSAPSYCEKIFFACGQEGPFLANDIFTSTVDGIANAAAPSVVEINTTRRFTIEESQFQ